MCQGFCQPGNQLVAITGPLLTRLPLAIASTERLMAIC
jgi:hypothetical protein